MTEVLRLKIALRESVNLQGHYAQLLNMWDGGERIEFRSAEEWLDLLEFLRLLPPQDDPIPSEKLEAIAAELVDELASKISRHDLLAIHDFFGKALELIVEDSPKQKSPG
jgi:hypothetical protein